ncbi:probable elongator complex protein 2 [Diprion similis]|uniref:probable elongator complex protein 2 n=1 Tax=Diprion similis TaxID=362088 RepID=UPI001EF7B58B|nr:probable elongator complex protein 2 [Diprion similis]
MKKHEIGETVKTSYISCACNRSPHSADWGNNDLLCYGARNAVAIYDRQASKTGKVLLTLHKHSNQVTVVRWIRRRNGEPETELISGSTDGTTIIWSKFGLTYRPATTLKDTSAVRIASAQYLNESNSRLLICTGNTDGQIKLWERGETGDEASCLQIVEFSRKLPIESALWFLPESNTPLLAIAVEDSTIQLFCRRLGNDGETTFVKVQSLAGHEDWVRCLDFTFDNDGDVLLASGSQDSMIRLWRISVQTEDEVQSNELRQKKEIFLADDKEYTVALESILISHEGWVYGVHWHPPEFEEKRRRQPMKLLSSSLDKTMILWEPDSSSGIWLESVRVGDVGGNSLGFYGCKFGPRGSSLLAHGYLGSFHIWEYSEKSRNWAARSAPGGHFLDVVDLCWDPKGRFLLTTSADQTTRAHTPWKDEAGETWHEIGRPQVHGFDMSCLAMLTPYIFASGAEEKVVRTFTAPATFVNYLKKLSNADDFAGSMPESASVPALGLTNKAVFDGEVAPGENLYVGNSRDLDFGKPPTEEELIQHTLWPELQKLYGHGYEVFSMAGRHDGTLLATCCKSSSAEHAAIILWDTATWKIQQKLMAHQLTVTQLAFSPNNEYLLSVSRDRRWSLFTCDKNQYNLSAASSKRDSLHSRIIWCCAWSNDSKYFATGSRDGKIGIWCPAEFKTKEYLPITSMEVKDASITALAFAPVNVARDSYVLAVGFESGDIEIQKIIFKGSSQVFRKYLTLNSSHAHHLTVKRLSFRPCIDISQSEILQLASCGSDNTVKIHDLRFKDLSLL